MKIKQFSVKYKDEGNGILEGYASTWIRKADSWGDVVAAGAFKESLENRWNGGKGIPLLWAHKMDDLNAFIGTANADEDEKGLHFVAEFDETEEAQRVRELYKSGRLSKFSFAYDVLEAGMTTLEDGAKANELRKLDIYEISCVLVPANDDAGVLDVKAGRRNRKSDEETLKQIITLANSMLDVAEDEDAGEPEGHEEPEANSTEEEQKGALKAEKDRLLEYIKSLDKTEV